jgi:hypothetical protein
LVQSPLGPWDPEQRGSHRNKCICSWGDFRGMQYQQVKHRANRKDLLAMPRQINAFNLVLKNKNTIHI